ncbi:major facilitator superfamily domain-containing protein [Hygrophoropsis aurantiaca]|uniref:Major facilitator superfamily domain-containing protein n=1 Tax=Hygrophoropsis aurantiaca TaxID=72124 RepID=A0ACB8ABL8_9AGAM|nr:major facilitator superfamily domain-containing protein [Hygrophoropsis aurantiaca]
MAIFLGRYIYKKIKERQQASRPNNAFTEDSEGSVPSLLSNKPNNNEGPFAAKNSQEGIQTLDRSNASEPASVPPSKPSQAAARSAFWFKIKLIVALLIPVFLETLDYTVVATAQSHIASVFNALDLQSYIGTSYLLSATVFLPLFASVADIFGRYTGLQISLFFFLLGSALSTGAVNMAMVLVGRGIAGIGAAGLLTIVRTILSDSSSLDDNNWQTSILFVLYAIGYICGPVFGGLLVQVSFRWVFAINLPATVVAMVLCFILLRGKVKAGQPCKRLPTSFEEKESFLHKILRIDWVGTFLFVVGGILILLALNWGSTSSWRLPKVIASWVIGGLLILACLCWEYLLEQQLLRSSPSKWTILCCDPMLPLEIFRSYNVCAVMYGCYVSGLVMLVMFYFVAIFMTVVTGLSPAKAGVQLIYFAPGMGAGSLISISLIKNLRQPKYPIILGSIIIPISLGLIAMAMGANNQGQVNGFMVMAGGGVGLTAGSLAIHARFSQPTHRVAIVNAMTLFFRSLGGTVGLAQCAAVMNAKVKQYISAQIRNGALSGPDLAALAQADTSQSLNSLQSLSALPPDVQNVIREAFRNGVRWAFISLLPWCCLSFFLLLFLSKITDQDRERDAAHAEQEREAYARAESISDPALDEKRTRQGTAK